MTLNFFNFELLYTFSYTLNLGNCVISLVNKFYCEFRKEKIETLHSNNDVRSEVLHLIAERYIVHILNIIHYFYI